MSAAAPSSGRRVALPRRLLGAAAVVALLLVVVLDTKVLSPQEVRRLNPPAFNAEAYGRETFPKVAAKLEADAADVKQLAPAVDDDVAAAAQKFKGVDLGSGTYAFPLKATGRVRSADADFVLLGVDGVPQGTEVRIPLGAALNGTPVRDAAGIRYGDFADQTDYQSAANQFKLRMQQDVLAKLDPKSLRGKTVTVTGAWSTGGPPGSFIVQPAKVQVGS